MALYEVFEAESENDIHERLNDLKEDVKARVYAAVDWITYHPQEAAAIAGGLIFAWKKLDKYMGMYRETKIRNSTIYDRSLGMYWETKRPLTTNQRLAIEARHKAGEPYGQILSSMNLLRR